MLELSIIFFDFSGQQLRFPKPGGWLRDRPQVSGRPEEPRNGVGLPRRNLRGRPDATQPLAVNAVWRGPGRRGHGEDLIQTFLSP